MGEVWLEKSRNAKKPLLATQIFLPKVFPAFRSFVVNPYFIQKAQQLNLWRSYWRWGGSATEASSGKKSISCSFCSSPATYTGGEGVVITIVVGYCDAHASLGGVGLGAGMHFLGGCWLGCHNWHAVVPPMTCSKLSKHSCSHVCVGDLHVNLHLGRISVIMINCVAGFSVWLFGRWLFIGALTDVTDSPWLGSPTHKRPLECFGAVRGTNTKNSRHKHKWPRGTNVTM